MSKIKNEEVIISDSESDHEEDNLPSGAECLARSKEFAKITNTDMALAMFYLQDTKWDLDKAVNAFYETTNETNSKVIACFDVGKLNKDERKKDSQPAKKKVRKSSSSNSDNDSAARSSSKSDDVQEEETVNKHFKILSWNIDGLDGNNCESRTLGVVETILKENPDVVLLQEVIVRTEDLLKDKLENKYNFINANTLGDIDGGYYTMILTRKSTCKVSSSKIINFDNTVMCRNLLQVKLKYNKYIDVCAMTAHLESTAEFSKQRIEQLRKCFKEMLDQDSSYCVFFGGDLNLRDSELNSIGGMPNKINDVWEATGSRKECLYTWDCMRNTNLKMNGKFKPRYRFDRLYFRRPNSEKSDNPYTLMPVYFELEGLQKLKSCGRFCSDHWAIQSYCQIEQSS